MKNALLLAFRSWKCLQRGWSKWLWSLEGNLPSLFSKTVSWRTQWREHSWQISSHRDRWDCTIIRACTACFQSWHSSILFFKSALTGSIFCLKYRFAAMGQEYLYRERLCPSSWKKWWRGPRPSLWVTRCWTEPEWEHWSASHTWRKCWDLSVRPRKKCV